MIGMSNFLSFALGWFSATIFAVLIVGLEERRRKP